MLSESSTTTKTAPSFRVSVNVRLCGGIPRKDLLSVASAMASTSPHATSNRLSGAPCSLAACLTSRGVFASANGSTDDPPTLSKTASPPFRDEPPSSSSGATKYNNIAATMGGCPVQQPLGLVLEPPSWAVPARGESRLEPVCDALERQSAVDLTSRACFRVGRSPNMDIQLLHATSSRRHALLFHHSNGSCYVVDCGSAHGTYVNGVRIASPSSGGLVVPHKVKRGALVRFGGPGAPCFLLKSFSFQLNELDESSSSAATTPDMGELVRRNTRLNALGRTAGERLRDSVFRTIDSALAVTRKRSFDSLDDQLQQPLCGGKRLRCCASPPPSPEEPPLRLVSPDLPPASIAKRVTFSSDPPRLFYPALVTPEELSSGEEDNAE